MTRREIQAWLRERRPAPPAALQRHLEAAVGESEERLPDHLAETGAVLLRQVAQASDRGRDVALDLLAADAFITYAFEAQAEADVAGLDSLAKRVAQAEGVA